MSSQIAVINRLLTAIMLVVLLIACQDSPKDSSIYSGFDKIRSINFK